MKRTGFTRKSPDPTKPAKPRKRIAQESAKRKAGKALRAEVVAEVLERAAGICEYRDVIPEFPCGTLPNQYTLQVDEIHGGSQRNLEMYDAEQCRAGCPVHHRIKTDGIVLPDGTFLGKRAVIARLLAYEAGRTS